MTSNFITRGTDYIKQAVEQDNAEQYNDALHLYSRGIEFLVTGMKYEKNKRVVATIRTKIEKYLARAEAIKKSLDIESKAKSSKKRKKTQKSSSTHTGTNSDDEDDDDTAKLKSALSEAIIMSKPNVKWTDVAGLDIAKSLLKEAVILPIRFPHIFVGKRRPWQGILLFGPPGTGKSYLAKAVASEANNSTFFSVSSSDLVSKYVGESEKLVKNLFAMARAKRPSIIFIDEIDSLAGSRGGNEADHTRRLKNEFLIQMSGAISEDMKGVLVLGATNCPWDLDPAVRRRFKKRIYIPLPDKNARSKMFEIHVGNTPNCLNKFDYDILSDKTKGFSGSDISAVVQDALMEPVRTMLMATHFKKVYKDIDSEYNNDSDNDNSDRDDNKDGENMNNKNNNNKNNKMEIDSNNDVDVITGGKGDSNNNNNNNNENSDHKDENGDIDMETNGNKKDGEKGLDRMEIEEEEKKGEIKKTNGESNDNNNNSGYVWMPCSPNDPNGVKMTLMQIPKEDQLKVAAEPLKVSHFLRILQTAKPSVGQKDIEKQIEWTKQYGQEGR